MVAIAHETTLFDVHEFRVYPMLTDSVAASPTYGAAVQAVGVSQIAVTPDFVTAVLKGDAKIIARRGRTEGFKLTAIYSKLGVDVLATVLGGVVTDVTGPPVETRWDLLAPAKLPFFKAEFKIEDVDLGLGDVHCILYKCILTGGTLLGGQSDNFDKPSLELQSWNPDFATTPIIRTRIFAVAQPLDA